jgi:hypothetical protein
MAKLYGDRQLGYQFDKKVYTRYAIEKRAFKVELRRELFRKGLPNTLDLQGSRRSLVLEPDSDDWDFWRVGL